MTSTITFGAVERTVEVTLFGEQLAVGMDERVLDATSINATAVVKVNGRNRVTEVENFIICLFVCLGGWVGGLLLVCGFFASLFGIVRRISCYRAVQ